MTPEDIRALRTELGITQQQFASLLDVSFVSVNRWENGHAEPMGGNRATLSLLSDALALTAPSIVRSRLHEADGDGAAILRVLVALGPRTLP